jgi:hypothetical protein
MLAHGHIGDIHDIDKLEELLVNLIDYRIRSTANHRQPGYLRILGRGDAQRLDVVAARGKQRGHPGKRASFVLQQYGNDVSHVVCNLLSESLPRTLAVERVKIDSDGGPEPTLLQYNGNCSTLGKLVNNKNSRPFSATSI